MELGLLDETRWSQLQSNRLFLLPHESDYVEGFGVQHRVEKLAHFDFNSDPECGDRLLQRERTLRTSPTPGSPTENQRRSREMLPM